MRDMEEAIAALVAIDPSLLQKRNRKITITDRGAKFFWSLFTYDARSIDPMSEKEQEQQVLKKQEEDIAMARSRSSTLIPLNKTGPTPADSAVVGLDDEWQDIKGGGSVTLPSRLPSQTLQKLRESAGPLDAARADHSSPPSSPAPAAATQTQPPSLPSISPASPPNRGSVRHSVAYASPPHNSASASSNSPIIPENQSNVAATTNTTTTKVAYNLDFGGEERRPLLEADGTPSPRRGSGGGVNGSINSSGGQAEQSAGDDPMCSWCSIS